MSSLASAVTGLSPTQLAGQLIVGGFEEQEPPAELRRALRAGERAGIIVFRRNLRDGLEGLVGLQALCAELSRAAPQSLPLLFGIDEEGGRVQRLRPPALRIPPLRRVADAWGPSGVRRLAALVGAELRCLGFTLNFAPVVDVDTNPQNPIIGDRAFGNTPARVIECGRAYLEGLHAAGIAGCLKHFPGHGDTETDSHLALPIVRHSAERLESLELLPFASLLAETDAVMSAHVRVEAWDPRAPATLSRLVLGGVLRERLGFDQVVFSDALEMGAIAQDWDLGTAAVAAIRAGCDLVLPCRSQDDQAAVHTALCRAILDESDFRAIAERAAQRSLRLRQRYPSAGGTPGELDALVSGPLAALQGDLDGLRG
jgi:beta-N-acetylhexosaminidase